VPLPNMLIGVAVIRRSAQIFHALTNPPHSGFNAMELNLDELEALEWVLTKLADAIELVVKETNDERPDTLHS
jgi:hypothetical protein